jgi:hypothetical protein
MLEESRDFLSPTTTLQRASLRTRLSSAFCFREADNLFADNVVFQKIDELNIELYTDKKDPDMETEIENILTSHELPYEKSEVWIEDEKMYEVLYQTQIIGG